jgi:hypothetical protein
MYAERDGPRCRFLFFWPGRAKVAAPALFNGQEATGNALRRFAADQ